MDETYINTLLNTIQAQRNAAFNQVAEHTASYAVLAKELEKVRAKLLSVQEDKAEE